MRKTIMQADAGMKKKERARLFLALAPSLALSPNLNKTLVRTLFEKHDTHILQGQKCQVHTPLLISPKPFFLSRKQACNECILSK